MTVEPQPGLAEVSALISQLDKALEGALDATHWVDINPAADLEAVLGFNGSVGAAQSSMCCRVESASSSERTRSGGETSSCSSGADDRSGVSLPDGAPGSGQTHSDNSTLESTTVATVFTEEPLLRCPGAHQSGQSKGLSARSSAASWPMTPTRPEHIAETLVMGGTSDVTSSTAATFKRPVAEWTSSDIRIWLASLSQVPAEVVETLCAHGITGAALPKSESELLALGIRKFGWRRRLMLAISKLSDSFADCQTSSGLPNDMSEMACEGQPTTVARVAHTSVRDSTRAPPVYSEKDTIVVPAQSIGRGSSEYTSASHIWEVQSNPRSDSSTHIAAGDPHLGSSDQSFAHGSFANAVAESPLLSPAEPRTFRAIVPSPTFSTSHDSLCVEFLSDSMGSEWSSTQTNGCLTTGTSRMRRFSWPSRSSACVVTENCAESEGTLQQAVEYRHSPEELVLPTSTHEQHCTSDAYTCHSPAWRQEVERARTPPRGGGPLVPRMSLKAAIDVMQNESTASSSIDGGASFGSSMPLDKEPSCATQKTVMPPVRAPQRSVVRHRSALMKPRSDRVLLASREDLATSTPCASACASASPLRQPVWAASSSVPRLLRHSASWAPSSRCQVQGSCSSLWPNGVAAGANYGTGTGARKVMRGDSGQRRVLVDVASNGHLRPSPSGANPQMHNMNVVLTVPPRTLAIARHTIGRASTGDTAVVCSGMTQPDLGEARKSSSAFACGLS